jgi:Na+-driven multidrug efflux pump
LYAFILGKWGAPRMGAAGAPFASGLSFVLCGAVLVSLWMRQKLTIKFYPGDIFQKARYQRLLHIGYPVALEQLVLQFGFFLFMSLIGHYYGTEAFAAYNVGVNMLNAAMVVGSGFSIAGATLVGQHLGAGDVEGAARSGWRACSMAVAAMSLTPPRWPVSFLEPMKSRCCAPRSLRTSWVLCCRCWESTWRSAAPCAAPATRASRS